jgi:AAA ATPase domain
LEQAASPGDVLLGVVTSALVREAVEVKALELKGKGGAVPAYRLVSVYEPRERRHETRFVGRVGELETLGQAWQRVCGERRCELVTVVGDAGVGKSRLAAEFLSSVEARSVGGRCLPYGEGITYWPVVEVIRQLHALPSDPAAAASIRSLLREADEVTSAEEIAWRSASCSRSRRRSSACSTTSSGVRRRSSIWSSTSPCCPAARRSCCSV